MRDHFTQVAEQSARSIGDSLQAAQEAAAMASSEQRTRTAELEQELKAVAALRKVALQLNPAIEATEGAATTPAVKSASTDRAVE